MEEEIQVHIIPIHKDDPNIIHREIPIHIEPPPPPSRSSRRVFGCFAPSRSPWPLLSFFRRFCRIFSLAKRNLTGNRLSALISYLRLVKNTAKLTKYTHSALTPLVPIVYQTSSKYDSFIHNPGHIVSKTRVYQCLCSVNCFPVAFVCSRTIWL